MPKNQYGQTLGNLSFRFKKGANAFIITASGIKSDFTLDSFVLVTSVNFKRRIVYAVGKRLPSSESMLHYAIYKKRKDVNAVFHGHSQAILDYAEKVNLPMTKNEKPYGSTALVNEVEKILKKIYFLIVKKHGFLSLGKNINQAGKMVLAIKKKCR
ncbi:MAG: class II aldolase/adducin family protein [Candidatus Margulisbacteria bacterium]|nr:class II aldolase/adducin family protein [Candidatus Margulisiibacteriota bacterium]